MNIRNDRYRTFGAIVVTALRSESPMAWTGRGRPSRSNPRWLLGAPPSEWFLLFIAEAISDTKTLATLVPATIPSAISF